MSLQLVVATLSDDEGTEADHPPQECERAIVTKEESTPPRRKSKATVRLTAAQTRGLLGRLVCQTCRCSTTRSAASAHQKPCLKQFRSKTESLFQLRWRLHCLSKRDMDNEVVL